MTEKNIFFRTLLKLNDTKITILRILRFLKKYLKLVLKQSTGLFQKIKNKQICLFKGEALYRRASPSCCLRQQFTPCGALN